MGTVKLTFMGVAVYRKLAHVGTTPDIIEVRLPDATPKGKGKSSKHWDDDDAAAHWLWLYGVPAPPNTRELRIPLLGATLLATGNQPSGQDKFEKLIDLNKVAANIKLRGDASDASASGPVGAKVTLIGGTLDGYESVPAELENVLCAPSAPKPSFRDPLFIPVWDSLKDTIVLSVSFDGHSTDITLKASDWDRVFILNHDLPVPTRDTVDREGGCEEGKRRDDEDFKWVYQLLEPSDVTTDTLDKRWKARLKKTIGHHKLPRPTQTCPPKNADGPSGLEAMLAASAPLVGRCLGGRIS